MNPAKWKPEHAEAARGILRDHPDDAETAAALARYGKQQAYLAKLKGEKAAPMNAHVAGPEEVAPLLAATRHGLGDVMAAARMIPGLGQVMRARLRLAGQGQTADDLIAAEDELPAAEKLAIGLGTTFLPGNPMNKAAGLLKLGQKAPGLINGVIHGIKTGAISSVLGGAADDIARAVGSVAEGGRQAIANSLSVDGGAVDALKAGGNEALGIIPNIWSQAAPRALLGGAMGGALGAVGSVPGILRNEKTPAGAAFNAGEATGIRTSARSGLVQPPSMTSITDATKPGGLKGPLTSKIDVAVERALPHAIEGMQRNVRSADAAQQRVMDYRELMNGVENAKASTKPLVQALIRGIEDRHFSGDELGKPNAELPVAGVNDLRTALRHAAEVEVVHPSAISPGEESYDLGLAKRYGIVDDATPRNPERIIRPSHSGLPLRPLPADRDPAMVARHPPIAVPKELGSPRRGFVSKDADTALPLAGGAHALPSEQEIALSSSDVLPPGLEPGNLDIPRNAPMLRGATKASPATLGGVGRFRHETPAQLEPETDRMWGPPSTARGGAPTERGIGEVAGVPTKRGGAVTARGLGGAPVPPSAREALQIQEDSVSEQLPTQSIPIRTARGLGVPDMLKAGPRWRGGELPPSSAEPMSTRLLGANGGEMPDVAVPTVPLNRSGVPALTEAPPLGKTLASAVAARPALDQTALSPGQVRPSNEPPVHPPLEESAPGGAVLRIRPKRASPTEHALIEGLIDAAAAAQKAQTGGKVDPKWGELTRAVREMRDVFPDPSLYGAGPIEPVTIPGKPGEPPMVLSGYSALMRHYKNALTARERVARGHNMEPGDFDPTDGKVLERLRNALHRYGPGDNTREITEALNQTAGATPEGTRALLDIAGIKLIDGIQPSTSIPLGNPGMAALRIAPRLMHNMDPAARAVGSRLPAISAELGRQDKPVRLARSIILDPLSQSIGRLLAVTKPPRKDFTHVHE